MNYQNTSILPIPAPFLDYQVEHNLVTRHKILLIGNFGSEHLFNMLDDHDLVHSGNYHEAAYHLQHLPAGSGQLPEVIIGYYDEGNFKHLADFGKFLNNGKKLAGVPFILIGEKENAAGKSGYKPIRGVDDIVRENISPEEFLKKIALLRKFKALKQREPKHILLQKNDIRADRKPIYKIDTFFKRTMDILLSALSIIILSPLLLLIAIIIKLDSKGPVFYTSYRAGSNYRIFKFIKFRTMVTEADHKLSKLMSQNQYGSSGKNNPVFFKISNDPRVTRFGKFLRNTSLDELPQLFNVLKADMSLVGNRPLPLYEAKVLTTDYHAERFNAPAGITGLWQISKRGHKEMSAEERIALDINYARHNSFAQDLHIMLKTPKALIQKDNV